MGREVKRVPLDFDWPLETVWKGFINELHDVSWECPECGGSGESHAMSLLTGKWYGSKVQFRPEERGSTPYEPTHPKILAQARRSLEQAPDYYGTGEAALEREARRLAGHFNKGWCYHLNEDDVSALIEAERLRDFTHDWTREGGWKEKNPPYRPSAQEINEYSLAGHLPDSWPVCKAEAKRQGIDEIYCPNCGGEGHCWPSPESKAQAEAWEPTEPPTGEGYQMWETVSEGSPISPVFATPEELARFMSETRYGADKDGTPYETWLRFIQGPGWAPSLVIGTDGVKSGVEGMVQDD